MLYHCFASIKSTNTEAAPPPQNLNIRTLTESMRRVQEALESERESVQRVQKALGEAVFCAFVPVQQGKQVCVERVCK